MKKIILLSFVIAAMIFLGMNVNSSVRISSSKNDKSIQYIHYQVNIHPNLAILHNGCPLMVSMRDASNLVIGQQQLYHPNMNVYDFYEMGPVSGVRRAMLVNADGYQPDDFCQVISCNDAKSGTFLNGWDYKYDLYGSTRDIIKPNNTGNNQ
jgi:hypothetical protein